MSPIEMGAPMWMGMRVSSEPFFHFYYLKTSDIPAEPYSPTGRNRVLCGADIEQEDVELTFMFYFYPDAICPGCYRRAKEIDRLGELAQ